jgi:multidrug efflux pump
MSSLSQMSISRPVLTWVLSIVIMIFGAVGFLFLGVREYPSVDPPIVTVSTSYTGANADVMESQITEPLEEAISGIAGIKTLTSTSRDGRSTITVEFTLETNIEDAAGDVRDKVAQAVGNLPPDADKPIVAKADANANPILILNVRSDAKSLLELTDIARRQFKERLQTINGVSEIFIWGAKDFSMRLWIDPLKLSAYNITPLEVRNALLKQNVELPAGRIEGEKTELSIRTLSRLSTPDEFNNLIIKQDGENIIKFNDIGRAELGAENLRTLLKRDNIPSVAVAIVPQPGSNQIEIADKVYERLEQIKKDLPDSVEVAIVADSTEFIRKSVNEVAETIITAFLLVIAVIFLFLRDWRTTLIPILAIPVSLIGSFFVMYLLGFSINVLTLLGIVLAIGLVVDDAIVLMENIYAKVEMGMSPLEAGRKGSDEIYFAVIATTIALIAVFLPVVFLQGTVGRLFREFGIVVATAVAISAFVALTLTPMLSTRLLKLREKHNWFYQFTEPFFIGMNKGYAYTLRKFLSVRWLAIPLTIFLGYLVYSFGKIIPSELAPLEDRSEFRASIKGPEGATFEFMENYTDTWVKHIQKTLPEREMLISVISPNFGASSSVNSAFVRVKLKNPKERKATQQELVNRLNKDLPKFTDAKTFISQPPSIGGSVRGGGTFPIEYVLQATSLEKLKSILPKFQEEVSKNPTFTFSDVDLKFNKPEIQLSIDREKATKLNVSILDIAQTLQFSLSGQRFGYFLLNGKQYQVIGQIDRPDRNAPTNLKEIYVKSSTGEMIQLDNLVSIKEESTPPQLYRYNRFTSATISAGLAPNKTIGDGIDEMNKIAKKVLDGSVTTSLSGQSKEFKESSSSLYLAFGFALLLIYLVLAAQFESFKAPLIIMLTVPLAVTGALLSLWLFKQTLNVFSQIGIIMLIGLVTKNGILLVEFAQQKQEEGETRLNASFEAAISRFRPILMTTLSTVLGTLPIALALGEGSQSRMPMGIAIVGGLIFSTILTLYIIPAMYAMMAGKVKRKEKIKEIA